MSHIYEIPCWNFSREIIQKAPTFVHSRVTTDDFCRTSTSLGRFWWSAVWKISTYIEREAASFVGNRFSGDVLCLRAYIKLSLHSSHPIKKSSTEHLRIHTELYWMSQGFAKPGAVKAILHLGATTNFYPYFLLLLSDLGENRRIRRAFNSVGIRKLMKMCAWKATLFIRVSNYTYRTHVKPCDILQAKNALLKSRSLQFAPF